MLVDELEIEKKIFFALEAVLRRRLAVSGTRIGPVKPNAVARIEIGMIPIEGVVALCPVPF